MRASWAIAAAVALPLWSSAPGNAGIEPPNPMEDDDLAVGVGIICNTSEQMQRLVSLRGDGRETTQAVSAVNNEARDPRACGVAAVAFMSGKMVELKQMDGRLVQIVRISVVAAFDGEQWSRVPAMTQYALIEPEGYAI